MGRFFNLKHMRSISFIGVILLIIAVFLFYLTTDFNVEELKLSHIMGIMAGIGIGLIIGGMVGYVSKGTAMKEAQRRKEMKQLQKEKEELEKQAAELAKEKHIVREQQTTLSQEKKTRNF